MPNMSHPAQAWVQGYRGQRSGNFNRVGDTIQQEIWPCKDGFVSFALRGGPARIPGLIAITQYMDEHGMAPPVLKDRDWTKYNNNLLTQAEVDAIAAPFAAFFKTKTMQELYDAACTRRLMLAPANTEREVLDSRQLAARALLHRARAAPVRGERAAASGPLRRVPARRASASARRRSTTRRRASPRGAPIRAPPTRRAARASGARGIFAGLKIARVRRRRRGAAGDALLRRPGRHGGQDRVAPAPRLPAHAARRRLGQARPQPVLRLPQPQQAQRRPQHEGSARHRARQAPDRLGRRGDRELRPRRDAEVGTRLRRRSPASSPA